MAQLKFRSNVQGYRTGWCNNEKTPHERCLGIISNGPMGFTPPIWCHCICHGEDFAPANHTYVTSDGTKEGKPLDISKNNHNS